MTLPVQQGVPKLRAILRNSVKQMTRIITRCRAYVTGEGVKGSSWLNGPHSLHADRGIIVAGWTSTCNFPLPLSPIKLLDKNALRARACLNTVDWPAAVFTAKTNLSWTRRGGRERDELVVKRGWIWSFIMEEIRWRYSKDKSASEWVKCVNRERCWRGGEVGNVWRFYENVWRKNATRM